MFSAEWNAFELRLSHGKWIDLSHEYSFFPFHAP